MKDFWKSRKFAYSMGTLLAAIVLALLPSVAELDPATRGMLEEMLPLIFVIGALIIFGHSATDIAATWRQGVAGKDWQTALHDLIDALAPGEIEIPQAEPGASVVVRVEPRLTAPGQPLRDADARGPDEAVR